MNKTTMTAMACFAAGSLFASVPVVNPGSVSMVQDASRKVTITYRLSGEPGIVTIDIQTNYVDGTETKWATIGGKNISHLYGDVNRINTNVSSDSHAYWRPDKSWKEGGKIEDGGVRAVVTAWATNAPPDYMVVDLETKTSPFFYADAESVPGGVQDRQYKTTKIVMRKVPAAGVIWRMGSPTTEEGRDDDGRDVYEPARMVVLSEDYYLAIYEMTQQQYYITTGGLENGDPTPSGFKNAENASVRPVENVTREHLRGNGAADRDFRWSGCGHKVADGASSGAAWASFYNFAYLRKMTGILFDLPTAAQWEYACRAGTGDAFNGGTLDEYGWYSANSDSETHEVGTKKPNKWGFYDMHGNVAEWVLDPWYIPTVDPTKTEIDPTTPGKGNSDRNYFYRGGNWNSAASACRSAANSVASDSTKTDKLGYRLWAPAVVSY